jgi:hypothetical protein
MKNRNLRKQEVTSENFMFCLKILIGDDLLVSNYNDQQTEQSLRSFEEGARKRLKLRFCLLFVIQWV